MRRLLIINILLLTIVSCKKEIATEPLIKGLATPFLLQGDTSVFYLSDYVLDFKKLDTVEFPVYCNPVKKNDSIYLIVKTGGGSALSSIKVKKGNSCEEIIVFNREKQKVTITYNGPEKFNMIKVIGSMNYWNRTNPDMKLKDGKWEQEFYLAPGTYEYLFFTDKKEFPDPQNPFKIGNYSVLKVGKFMPEDLPFITTKSHDGRTINFETSQKLDEVYAFWQNTRLTAIVDSNKFSIEIPKAAGKLNRSFIKIYAYNANGISNDILVPLQKGEVVSDVAELNRGDKQTMIMYFLMVDRFCNGDSSNDKPVPDKDILPIANYMGGDLEGVVKKIDEGYFSGLGINTICLSPVSQNPEGAFGLWKTPYTKFSGYHGYWPISNIRIDYRFGNTAIFHSLVDMAHAGNMNVLLDYVAHHVHQEHPVYKLHPDWVTNLYLPDGTLNTEKWDDCRLRTWFDTFLPTLDLRRKEVVDALVDSAVFWLKEYNIDGFRHDATKHIDEIYWRTLTQKIKKISGDKPFYQIGETYGSPLLINSYISTGMLDAQFDFNVYDNATACFATDNESFARLKTVLSESWKLYGYNNLMGNISGNQDRGRFISYAGGSLLFNENATLAGWTRNITVGDSASFDKLAMLHAFNMTIPGIPVVYYGDEIGMPGGNDPDNRRMMKFDNLVSREKELKNTVKKLIDVRKNSMALLYGQTRILQADSTFMVYTRTYFDDKVLVVFNKSKNGQYLEIDLPNASEKVRSEFGSQTNIEGKKLEVELNPESFEIIHY
jgi:cyclomaltodextrinase